MKRATKEKEEKKETYNLGKKCEDCGKAIPDSFVNDLCWDCYQVVEGGKFTSAREIAKAVKETKKEPKVKEKAKEKVKTPEVLKNDITQSNYIENPEIKSKEQWLSNVMMFERNGVMLWKDSRRMYTYIKTYCLDRITQHPQYPKFIWKPKIVDVGCGIGLGSNILSQEADLVWGFDKNERTIIFAKECFERTKNQIYYSPQVSFECLDIFEDTRETAKFDVVVAIEIIEHINDYKGFLNLIIGKFAKKDKKGNYNLVEPTEFFISTPNRSNKHIGNITPKNKSHVREWTASEFYGILDRYFNEIRFHNTLGVEIPNKDIEKTTHTPLLIRCWSPKI